MIDKRTHEVKQDEEKIVYKSLEEIGDELPDNSPRFVLLSYPLTMVRCANLRPLRPGRVGSHPSRTDARTGILHTRPVKLHSFPQDETLCRLY